MGTGEEQQQQQEGGFQREVDAAEKSLAVVMVAVRRRFKLFFCNPQCETFKESGCEGTKNHLDGPKSQKCSEPLL